ncbi:MAG: hypothetical protein LBJ12_04560 [Oscillospiraceae bacterium]|jgi:hypothetical protein|nr:hypothetical protein [Oscillospiraceae bacterium]
MSTLHRYLKQYWKRGKIKSAFLPNYQNCGALGKERNSVNSKRGRPRKYGENSGRNVDEETEKAVKKCYHSRDGYSLKAAYDLMIKEHYTKFVAQPDGTGKAELLPENENPTGKPSTRTTDITSGCCQYSVHRFLEVDIFDRDWHMDWRPSS